MNVNAPGIIQIIMGMNDTGYTKPKPRMKWDFGHT